MSRFVLLLGAITAAFMVYNFNIGEFTMDDAFDVLELEEPQDRGQTLDYFPSLNSSKRYYDRIFDRIESAMTYASDINVAIVPNNLSEAASLGEFFHGLNAQVDTFYVLAMNSSDTQDYNFSTTKYGFDTPYGKLETNSKKIRDFNGINIGISDAAFDGEISISTLAPFMKKEFPGADIVPILVKEDISDDELDEFVYKLNAQFDNRSFLIASSSFAKDLDPLVNKFHDELSVNLIENADVNALKMADISSKAVVYIAMKFANANGRGDVINNNPVFLFNKGESDADRDLTILAFGDMMMGRYVRTLMDRNGGKDYVFRNIEGPGKKFFSGADIIHANFEGPINGVGRSGGTAMVFSFNEDIAPFLKEYNFNLVSIANNHATDQGWDGRDKTITALDNAGVGWCGHPSEADITSVKYGKVGDKDYAFVCFHDVTYKLNDEAALQLIRDVRPNVDYLIVSIHWGYEYGHRPDWGAQIEPGHAFVDAGADFVIGHHPHVVQSFEVYKDKFIFYSLGNFVFDQYWSTETQEELAIGIVLDDADESEAFSTKVYLFPMKSEMSQSRLMYGDEKLRWIEEFIEYSEYSEEMKEMIRKGVIEIK